MNFVVIDLVLLTLFVIFVSVFLYKNKKNLKRDGLLYLYRTSWGIKLIDRTSKRYQKTLKVLSYVSIAIGYVLMGGILYLFGRIVYLYIAYPSVVRAIKIPPVTPLFPYVDRLVPNLGLPSFYFVYFIVILGIIAITHEFAHGIFMRRYNIKIKSTGFGFFPFFLPVFLAAFVEQDEESMQKSSVFHQLSVLSAGTFANILTAIVFFLVLAGFFVLSFSPAGAQFNTYSYSGVELSAITSVNGIETMNLTYEKLVDLSVDEGYNKIKVNEKMFVSTKEFLEGQDPGLSYVVLYDDAPAIEAKLKGAITEFNGVKINDWDSLGNEISKYSSGSEVKIKTTEDTYDVVLGENPSNPTKAWLGIGYNEAQRKGIIGRFIQWISSFKKQNIYYTPNFGMAEFIYDFIWWLVLISFSVALVNMLPMGIFDGGKFFYLTIFSFTKSKKKAEKWFIGITRFLLFLLLVLMVFWVMALI